MREAGKRDECWSEAVAVGSQAFVEAVKRELGMKAQHRNIDEANGAYALCEPGHGYRTPVHRSVPSILPVRPTRCCAAGLHDG